MTTRIYLGLKDGQRTMFRSADSPTEATHGHLYSAVVGPFRTKRAAILMRDCGNSPHIQSVHDAERIARLQANQLYE